MDDQGDPTANAVTTTLEREMQLIREAISLVASGRASRMVVSNLRLADPLLEPSRMIARRAGVRITPLWRADEEGLDIAIERNDT